jgi:uncharacterized repeat protein (TIGR01451 family)
MVQPTNGDTFVLFSTGIAGTNIVTTNQQEPGDERGTWFRNKYGNPRDEAHLTMTLQVPPLMHYVYYDVQFFSSEYPEYIGSRYNDKLTITVYSPSKGVSDYIFDVNSGYFLWDSNDIPDTGFDIFAQSGNPGQVDWIDTTPRNPGADAGASDIIPIGGESHPVTPNEEITVTISIKDAGDNLFDSAAFVDNIRFSGEAQTEISARKSVYTENNEVIDLDDVVECGDIIKYKVVITNIGLVDQPDNTGNEFEDILPECVTYVNDSATAIYGTIDYDAINNKIIWNGEIPAESSRSLEFEVTVNEGLENGYIVSNQGMVYYDSNEDGNNDATELTDDLRLGDGIDQDGDGETDDDDPTNVTVYSFDYPDYVIEDFSDDTPGEIATQSYVGRYWFETGNVTCGSVFEVASSYYYQTAQSFKTKIRNSCSPVIWDYSIPELEGTVTWWEIWFACGNASEEYDLYLEFKDEDNQDIAKIKVEYVEMGTDYPTTWLAELYYYDPVAGWSRLYSNYTGGYLFNGWYKLRIEKNGVNYINYYLNQTGGYYDFATSQKLTASLAQLGKIEWKSTTEPDPIVCPMFFWDENKIGLTY